VPSLLHLWHLTEYSSEPEQEGPCFQTVLVTSTVRYCTIVSVGNFTGNNHMELQMSRTANDDRSDSMNPNNDSYDDSQDNRSDQLNPNNDRYQGDDGDDE
jgi:hypothetical protein